MKPILLIICILRLIDSSAQSGFLDHKYTWTEAYTCSGIGFWANTNRFTIDSTPFEFNGEYFYEVLMSTTPAGNNFEGTARFIRTDSNNHVFFLQNGNAGLLYDFDLMVGDTFQTNNDYDCDLVVGDIDTITLLNGEERKKWIMYFSGDDYHPEYSYGYPYWIEGIGSSNGLFGNEVMCQIDGCGSWYLCIFWEEEIILMYDDTCWLYISSDITPSSINIKVYPNPAVSNLEISDPDSLLKSISITGLDRKTHYQGADTQIDIINLPPGIYFAQITLKNGNRFVQKLIKQ
jgi:hypothetical protein